MAAPAKITVKETPIDEAVSVNAAIPEFGEPYRKEHFEERYRGKEKLVLLAYLGRKPVGYLVGYDRFSDGSFYCWMAGVNPESRGRGALKAMLDYLEKWALRKGYVKIKIKTRNSRREMLSYLVKYGFDFIEVIAHADGDGRILLEKRI